MIAQLTRLARDTRGAAALEFALVAPPFLLLILGVLDLSHIMLARSMVQGATEKAGRDSTLEGGAAAAARIDDAVRSQILAVVPGATITTTRKTYQDFENIGKPEPFVDANTNGVRDGKECFQDVNGNSRWDTDAASTGQGGATEVALYTVNVTYAHWFPMPGLISLITKQPEDTSGVRLSASTVLRNQPYAEDVLPRIIC